MAHSHKGFYDISVNLTDLGFYRVHPVSPEAQVWLDETADDDAEFYQGDLVIAACDLHAFLTKAQVAGFGVDY